jgi:hypothetical protein
MAHATEEDEEAPGKCSLGEEEHQTAGNGWRPEKNKAAARAKVEGTAVQGVHGREKGEAGARLRPL